MSFLQRAKNWQNSKISYEKARQSQDNFKVTLRKSKLQEELRIKRFAIPFLTIGNNIESDSNIDIKNENFEHFVLNSTIEDLIFANISSVFMEKLQDDCTVYQTLRVIGILLSRNEKNILRILTFDILNKILNILKTDQNDTFKFLSLNCIQNLSNYNSFTNLISPVELLGTLFQIYEFRFIVQYIHIFLNVLEQGLLFSENVVLYISNYFSDFMNNLTVSEILENYSKSYIRETIIYSLSGLKICLERLENPSILIEKMIFSELYSKLFRILEFNESFYILLIPCLELVNACLYFYYNLYDEENEEERLCVIAKLCKSPYKEIEKLALKYLGNLTFGNEFQRSLIIPIFFEIIENLNYQIYNNEEIGYIALDLIINCENEQFDNLIRFEKNSQCIIMTYLIRMLESYKPLCVSLSLEAFEILFEKNSQFEEIFFKYSGKETIEKLFNHKNLELNKKIEIFIEKFFDSKDSDFTN